MRFHTIEIPIGSSMIGLAERADHPFQRYFCYWAAFNNIYTKIADRKGNTAQLNFDDNTGQPKVFNIWSYAFPSVRIPKEKELISGAITQINNQSKHELISHSITSFFVERLPHGVCSRFDNQGQFINGVLNVTKTIDQNHPIWSPINKSAYERYIAGDTSERDLLAEQIIFMLYTIRNNLVHGGKNPGEENDVSVVENALPLLEIVVRGFLRD